MQDQHHDEERRRGSIKRRPKLLFKIVTFLTVMVSVSPYGALYFHLQLVQSPSLLPFSPDMTQQNSRVFSTSIPCSFGPCLKWNTTNLKSFPCATVRPLRWYQEEWNSHRKALYERHKRTMHFEVIKLVRTNSTALFSCEDNYPQMITYFHIFKNGGTTMRNAFWNEQTSLPYVAKILFTGIQQRIGTSRFHDRLNDTILRLYDGQQREHHENTAFAYTFLRDPVTRFLSGLGQVLNKFKTGKLSQSFQLSPCFSKTLSTSAMLDCSLEKLLPMMDANQSEEFRFYDFHILPQAFLLRDFTGEQDISMIVMDMNHIPHVLEALLPSNTKAERRWWARQSRNVDYTGGHDLSNPSILTKLQRRKICHLYQMDVELLANTNVLPHNLCSRLGRDLLI
jgi:hypothetical protein